MFKMSLARRFARAHILNVFKTRNHAARRAGMLAAGITLLVFDALIVQALLRRGTPVDVHLYLLLMWPAAVGVGGMTAALAMRWPLLAGSLVRETTAFVVPAVGAALALPLTIQLAYFVVIDGEVHVNSFNGWAKFGAAFTGIAHIWFAGCVGRRAAQLARGEEPLRVWTIYWSTVLMSAFPGILLFGLPPLVTAATGLPILPLLHLMRRVPVGRDEVSLPLARVLV